MTNRIFCLLIFLISIGAKSQVVIKDVTIVDVENNQLVNHQSVVVEGNTIKAIAPSASFNIPANARIIIGTHKFLMPGLTEAHAHPWDGDMYSDDGIDLTKYKPFQQAIDESKTRMAANYKRFLQSGITTIIAPGTTISTLKISDSLSHLNLTPTLYMAGKLITVSDFGNPHNLSSDDEYFDFAYNTEAAKHVVQNQLALHPSLIKILFVPDLTWSHIEDSARAKYPIVKTIINEAHKNGLKVAVHATERITAQLAVEAGCDYLAHGIHDEIITDDFIKLLKQKHIVLCPTSNVEYPILRAYTQHPEYTSYELSHADPFVVKTFFDLQDLDSALYRTTKLRRESSKKMFYRDSIRLINLKKIADAGIPVLTGTDVGSLGDMPATSYLPELLKMKQSGMSNWQIIKAATFNPTYFLGNEKTSGSIAAGKGADMILLNKNPVEDLENLKEISLVFKNGKAIFPDTLINETPEMLVQRQWNAYNAKNSQAFLACFDNDVKFYNFPTALLYKGIKELERNYSSQLQNTSKTHCEIKSRIILSKTVVDKIVIKEDGKTNDEQIVIFKINNHKIDNVYFIK